jgi:hypothetical protein
MGRISWRIHKDRFIESATGRQGGVMPYATEFVEGGRGIIFCGFGVLTENELVEAKLALKSNAEAMRHVAFALIDLKNVDELNLDSKSVRRLVGIDELLAKLATNMVVGIVAPSDHLFGIARMWEANASDTGWPIHVVRSHAEANAWFAEMLAPGRSNQPQATL